MLPNNNTNNNNNNNNSNNNNNNNNSEKGIYPKGYLNNIYLIILIRQFLGFFR